MVPPTMTKKVFQNSSARVVLTMNLAAFQNARNSFKETLEVIPSMRKILRGFAGDMEKLALRDSLKGVPEGFGRPPISLSKPPSQSYSGTFF